MRGLVPVGAALALLASTPSPAPAQSAALLEAHREGEALYAAGRYAEAEPRWREVLARAERELGPEHPGTAGLLGNLAALYRQEGRPADAEPLYPRPLAGGGAALRPGHPHTAPAP